MAPPESTAPDAQTAAALTLLERLVAFDTESTKSNLVLVDFVEAYLRDLGVGWVKTFNPEGDKAALLATIGPETDGGVVLSGHTDCVSVAGQAWTGDPFTLRALGGRLYARGACDMKGFDAVALAAVPIFQRAGLRRPIHILLSYDEETTCLGPMEIIARFGRDLPRPGAAIVGEPTMMQVADAHKSISTYFTTVLGHPAHSAKPALGANAIEAACMLVTELYRISDDLEAAGDPSGRFDPPCSTVHVGTIQGGTSRNILARECRFHWELRGLPGVPFDLAVRRLDEYARRAALPRLTRFVTDASIETRTQVEIPGLAVDPGSAAETLALKLTNSNRTVALSYATEAGRFQGAGIPTIVCGPGSIDQAHQPDEYIELAQIEAGLAFMRRLARELA